MGKINSFWKLNLPCNKKLMNTNPTKTPNKMLEMAYPMNNEDNINARSTGKNSSLLKRLFTVVKALLKIV